MSDSSQPHGLQPIKAPPSMGFARQEYWSGVPLPSPPHLSACARSPPSGQAPGSHMVCSIRSLRKQHGALCRPPPAPSTRCYSNLQRSPSLAPHPPGRGAKAVAQLVLCRAPGAQGAPEPPQQDSHSPDNLTRPRCSELRPVPRPEALPCPGRYAPQARTGASSTLLPGGLGG